MTVRVERDLMMETRDGVRLVADVYLPEAEGPFPTLLYRVRGSKSSAFIAGTILLNPIVAAERGYAVCIQEVRGRGGSGGEWHPFVHEADDGVDTLEWLRTQQWCNGRVGSYGTAYTGIAALELAATGHDMLQAVVAVVSGVSPHEGWIYTGGAFELGWNNFWAHLTAGSSIARLDVDADHKSQLQANLQKVMAQPWGPMLEMPLVHQPALQEASPHYWTWIDHSTYDDYWKALDVVAQADRIHARVLSVTGWWDNFLGSHLDLYRALAERSPNGADQRLVIGPWDHFTYVNVLPTMAGAKNFGPIGVAGAGVSEPAALSWFDRWLRDEPESADTQPGVRWFRSGAYEWTVDDAWPPPAVETPLYLSGSGGLVTNTSAAEATTYRYDPADPTPTLGGRVLMPSVSPAGVQDQAPNVHRPDVAAFQTDQLETPIEIAGEIRLDVWISADVVDTDLSAVLVDVTPDGERWLVADGYLRLKHRHGFDRIDMLEQDEVVHATIDLWASAWTFDAGHRIGLHIASASFPRFDRNLNTGQAPGEGTLEDAQVATVTIHHGGDTPSALVLPVRD